MVRLDTTERERLLKALRGNAEQGDAILMNKSDTSFVGHAPADEVPDDEVFAAISSVPCHY